MLTSYHAKYFAHDLTRQGPSDELERLGQSLFDARVDLNPHQVEAALFALQNPLQKGVILADEVGLGKTIEAGLVLCQKWAERKRKLVVVCPAHIRKQWALELAEKFSLPSQVIDARSHLAARKAGVVNPFDCGKIAIVSYAYAARMKDALRAVAWDLVVLDEAHKLRNAYQPAKKSGQAIHFAFELRRKVLLTATPLQNSLLELYGLGWMIDPHLFGNKESFQARYCHAGGDLAGLRQRMAQFVKRTLRRDVLEYVKYTQRHALTQSFAPTNDEAQLARAVQAFLQREESYALPSRQRHLVAMIAHKVLASSPQALVGTLEVMKARLENLRDGLAPEADDDLLAQFAADDDMSVEDLRELLDEEEDGEAGDDVAAVDPRLLKEELQVLGSLIAQARGLTTDSKAQSLLKALDAGFAKMRSLGAARKALVFTESRRTQEFLCEFLEKNGHKGKVVAFNGNNTHPQAKAVYEAWADKHRDSDRMTGSKAVDMRTALVDHFAGEGEILIATEAAAEGINLQFCSLVVNYDLPWNPQRIEQRIGRCHRYGQKHDVVVVNFLNQENPADQRVQQLLQEKFHLFDGLFGASDEVLGAIESGVDFEQRVLAIYQTCRTPGAITAAFDQLQRDLEAQIQSRMQKARTQLLENFDADVHDKLKVSHQKTQAALDVFGKRFWALSQWALRSCADFDDEALAFTLAEPPVAEARAGRYLLISAAKTDAGEQAHLHRLGQPLGQWVLGQGRTATTPPATVKFDCSGHPVKISMLEPLKGKGGWLRLLRVVTEAEEREEFLIFAAVRDDGQSLDAELARKLWELAGAEGEAGAWTESMRERLEAEAVQAVEGTLLLHSASVNRRLSVAQTQLDEWADDRIAPEREKLADLEAQQRAARKQARTATTLDAKLAAEQEARRAEKAIRAQEDALKDLRRELDDKLDALFDELKLRAKGKTATEELFTVRWEVG